MKLNRIRLGPRLAIAFFGLMLLGATTIAVGWWRLEQAHLDFADLQRWHDRAAQAVEWEGHTRLNVNRALVMALTQADGEAFAKLAPAIKETSAQISKLQKQLEADADQPQGKALFAELGERRTKYLQARERLFDKMKRKEPDVASALEGELMPAATAYLAQIALLREHQQALVGQLVKAKNDSIERAQLGLLLLGAAAIGLSVLGSWLITRSVTAPLRHALERTARIADGDLSRTAPAEGRDEVAQLLGGLTQMQHSLRNVVQEVRDTTVSIHTASTEVAEGSIDLSGRTELAAANLQQTASAIEQIAASAQQNADSAKSASVLASQAREAAQRGGEVVAQVVQTMSQISSRSRGIADITGLIDGIAFQTNILALNAAVEAARAGEQGRGFAVVASEVRALARRSADAAREIKTLIEANVGSVQGGAEFVSQAGARMDDILAAINRVADIVGQIAQASHEQSSSVSQVSGAVAQLDQMTQQNAALVEESAAAASSLRDQAARLTEVLAVFRTSEATTDAGAAVAARG